MDICIGDPDAIRSEDDGKKDMAIWERLSKRSKWNFKECYFEYGARERRVFNWVRTTSRWSPRVMELRIAKEIQDVTEADGNEHSGNGDDEEVVAIWKSDRKFKSRCRTGNLWLRKKVN